VFLWGLQKWVKWGFWLERCFGSNFIWFWSSFCVWKCLGKFWKSIWDWGVQNWDFGMKKWVFRDSQLSVLATASKLVREASNMVTESHVCPPRRAKLLATASIVSQEACFARHGEQEHSPWRATWWQRGYSARHGELLYLGGELPLVQNWHKNYVYYTYFIKKNVWNINKVAVL